MKKTLTTLCLLGIVATGFSGAELGLVGPWFEEPVEDASLNGKAKMWGVVTSPDGSRAWGAEVSTHGGVATATNDTGYFELILPPGKYLLKVRQDKYRCDMWDTMEVKANMSYQGHFHLYDPNVPVAKPVIYLYPESKQKVDIQLDFKGQLGFTYPEYHEGWSVNAKPDGQLSIGRKDYGYLFWDGESHTPLLTPNDTKEGFVVHKAETAEFLEETLTMIGLNSRERQDFITYWTPLLMANEVNYVHFLVGEDYNRVAEMKVSPEPDSMLRVFMVYTGLPYGSSLHVHPQELKPFERTGFTLIEWGGGEQEIFRADP